MEALPPQFVDVVVRVRDEGGALFEVPRRTVTQQWGSGMAGALERVVDDHHTLALSDLAAVELGRIGVVENQLAAAEDGL